MKPDQTQSGTRSSASLSQFDWPTIVLLLLTIAVWAGALMLPSGWGALAFVMLVAALTLHSSLSHEILHGHPFGIERVETVLGLWQPGLFVPYLRFKRLHLSHHKDANLTDPYDDPESNYFDPAVWKKMVGWRRIALRVNNTLAGRMAIGPIIGTYAFVRADVLAIRAGDPYALRDWLLHIPGVALTLWAVSMSDLSLWIYFAACYCALSVLRIRTFLEHQAERHVAERTVIIEDRGILGFLFLNNNLHVVHHMNPAVSWYRLWPLYLEQRDRFVARNNGYVFTSYAEIFRRYFLKAKDPVVHPLWHDGAE